MEVVTTTAMMRNNKTGFLDARVHGRCSSGGQPCPHSLPSACPAPRYRQRMGATSGGDRPPVAARPLIDRYRRVATDLRVSLTDRCNLRCSYCMPPDGLPWLPTPSVLTDAEVIRLIGIAVGQLGVTEVRFTGGEPLLRPGLPDIVAGVAALRPRPRIALTTNGI